MSIRKILLGAGAALVLGAGGFVALHGRLAATADAATVAAPPPAPMGPLTETPFRFGSFGAVTIYRRAAEPSRFVVLISDRAGWTPQLTDLARRVTTQDATVVGVDLRRFLPTPSKRPEATGSIRPATSPNSPRPRRRR